MHTIKKSLVFTLLAPLAFLMACEQKNMDTASASADVQIAKQNPEQPKAEPDPAKPPKSFFEQADEYYFGKNGVEQNYDKAFELFSKAYEEEKQAKEKEEFYPSCANIALGNMYYTGRGVKKDIKKALELWDQKDEGETRDRDQRGLPEVYSVEAYNNIREYVIQHKDTKRALEEGNACIHIYYGNYGYGYYGECNHADPDNMDACEQGMQWYKLAAEFGNTKAKMLLATNYLIGGGGPDNCYDILHGGPYASPEPELMQEGKKWLLSAAKDGDIEAFRLLGDIYFYPDADEQQDHREAAKWYLKAASKGDDESALMLARLYAGDKSSALPPDYAKALRWANEAVKRGESGAKYYLGLLYYNGNGVKKNHKKALELFKGVEEEVSNYAYLKSREMLQKMYLDAELPVKDFEGLEDSVCAFCGRICVRGWIGGKENYEKAELADLWRAAFEKNDIWAQIHLMHRYEKEPNPLNPDSLAILRALIALHKEPQDDFAKEEWQKAKQTIEVEQSPAMFFQAGYRGDLIQAATTKNDTQAQRKMGATYIRRAKEAYKVSDYDTARKDLTPAMEWYALAAWSGDAIAQVQLASMYADEDTGEYSVFGSANNVAEQIYWLEKAAEQGNGLALYELANIYYRGFHLGDEWGSICTSGLWEVYVAENKQKAFNLYQKSAEAGYAPAMEKLAQMYETGDYVAKDEEKARYWREKEQNSTDNYKEWNSYAGEEYASKEEQKE